MDNDTAIRNILIQNGHQDVHEITKEQVDDEDVRYCKMLAKPFTTGGSVFVGTDEEAQVVIDKYMATKPRIYG